jgi:hypothetical protein
MLQRELNISIAHSTVGLAQQWDQLDQLGMRMQHNLEQQIQARNQSGVSEDALKEFSMMFKVCSGGVRGVFRRCSR